MGNITAYKSTAWAGITQSNGWLRYVGLATVIVFKSIAIIVTVLYVGHGFAEANPIAALGEQRSSLFYIVVALLYLPVYIWFMFLNRSPVRLLRIVSSPAMIALVLLSLFDGITDMLVVTGW